MDLTLDDAALSAAVQESALGAVQEGLGGWKTKQAIADTISDEVADGVIGKAIARAVEGMDAEGLTETLAKEIQRSVTAATVHIIREGLFQTVCLLRKIGDYSDEDKAKRTRLWSELFGGA